MPAPVTAQAKVDPLWIPLLTVLALVAFAANSVLCRLALGQQAIDATSFTVIRLVSGALALLLIRVFIGGKRQTTDRGNWPSALALFLYAITFSFAYVTLTTATGALILFPSVQFTMVGVALYRGERPHPLEWLGLAVALGGLIYLLLPGVSAPSPLGSFLMTIAGISWGVYTLRGRNLANPIAVTS
ncbi:MAG: EamA family transporter, partial [Deltaproteobacteria bacterium]|nr:EamA family transporter [Deltaproteobacteria bacterium]